MESVANDIAVRFWLRVDSLEPLSCSVRFSLREGEGYLDWGDGPSAGAGRAARTASAGGLTGADLSHLALVVLPGAGLQGGRMSVSVPSLPAAARSAVGSWVELDSELMLEVEDTDLVFSLNVVAPASVVVPRRPTMSDCALDSAQLRPLMVEVMEEPDSEVSPAGAPVPPPPEPEPAPSGSALVRSLVQRIRQQEEEIKSLRQELAALRSAQS